MEVLGIEAAKRRPDLRLALTAGVPEPWGETAKGLFYVKKIPYTAVAQEGGGEDAELRAWTGHDDAPIVVHADEPPRTVGTTSSSLPSAGRPSRRQLPLDF